MRFLNLSSDDYANMAHNNARALRSIGIECVDLTMNKHAFNYESQSISSATNSIKATYKNFDVVQVFHSCPVIFDLVKDHPKLIVYHSGTRYRNEPEKFNELFNQNVLMSFTDQCEFMGLGAKNLHYIAPHIELKPVFKRGEGKTIIGHYPSKASVKGTDEIRQMLKPFEDMFEIRIDETLIPHEENLKRIAECHIYVELYKPTLFDKPYGCFGVTAFEATALGCQVVTNNINPPAYENEYGSCAFKIANTPEDFHATILALNEMRKLQLMTSEDFYMKHNIEATGKRIIETIKKYES